MPDERITILAILDGWQSGCWHLAKTGKPFALEGVNPNCYHEFCQALCKAYNYRSSVFGHRITFDPVVEKSAA